MLATRPGQLLAHDAGGAASGPSVAPNTETATFESGNTRFEAARNTTLPDGVVVKLSVGFNPGSLGNHPIGHKVIEDRGAALIRPDGSVIAGVLDGVGEVYSDQNKRTLYTAPDGQQRCLGDVPGLILWNTLKEGPLNSERLVQPNSEGSLFCPPIQKLA